MRMPCDECNRVHPGRVCGEDEPRSQKMTIQLPSWLHDAVREAVPYGERSAWFADLADRELRK